MIKYAIIGCGVIAPKHAEAVCAQENACLAAVCDVVGEKAISLARKFGAPQWYTDYREMLERADIDAVSICVPSGLHADIAIDCANAHKHILCEKPLDILTDKMDAMIRAAADNSVKLAGVFQNRTYSGAIAAKKLLDSGEMGRILIADCYTKEYRSPEYYRSAGWRGTWELDGGGCLMNQGVHAVDILAWFAGPVKTILGRIETKARAIEVEDCAFAILKFQNGATGVIEGSTISAPGRDDYVEIQCEKGRIIYDSGRTCLVRDDSPEPVCLDTDAPDASNTANDPSAFTAKGHTYLVRDLVTAILEDREPYIPAESARKAVDIILGIYRSSRENREIEFPSL